MKTKVALNSIGEILTEAMYPADVDIGGFTISAGLLAGIVTSLIIIIAALIIRIFIIPRFKEVPTSRIQHFLEGLVGFFGGMSKDNVPEYKKSVSPYLFGAGLFICIGTLTELLGLRPVFADINACIAMALTTFILINFYGIKRNGIAGRLTHNFRKSGFAGFFQIISDLLLPFSMTLRLYASILSGFLIMTLVYSIAYLTVGVPVILSIIFTVFHAFIQAYVFSLLSAIFIGEAAEAMPHKQRKTHNAATHNEGLK